MAIKKLLLMNEAKKSLDKHEDIYNIKVWNIFENSVKKAIKRKSEEFPEDNKDNDNKNVDFKEKYTFSFDNFKHNIYIDISINIFQKILVHLMNSQKNQDFIKQ